MTGVVRCWESADPAYVGYHDEEWAGMEELELK